MNTAMHHRLAELRQGVLRAQAARDRLAARARPAPAGARSSLARSLAAALAVVALIVGVR